VSADRNTAGPFARPCAREGCSFIALSGDICRWHADEDREKRTARLLYVHWDPIGCVVPEDEYAAYAKPVVEMIDAAATRDDAIAVLAGYLVWVRVAVMGLDGDAKSVAHEANVAKLLVNELGSWNRLDERAKGIQDALRAARGSDVREGWSAPVEAIEAMIVSEAADEWDHVRGVALNVLVGGITAETPYPNPAIMARAIASGVMAGKVRK